VPFVIQPWHYESAIVIVGHLDRVHYVMSIVQYTRVAISPLNHIALLYLLPTSALLRLTF
jgi:hypothetical protein